MKALGLDIGTTTVSAVVVENREVLSSLTLKNDSFLPVKQNWERMQSPRRICEVGLQAVETLLSRHPNVERIGVTGQMHGILYLDKAGIPVSPLYTWQDGRGDQPYREGRTYAQWLSEKTGYSLAAGYGTVTHFYNLDRGLVPETAAVMCTIHDYMAMVLAGKKVPVTDASDGASLGVFRVDRGVFDREALANGGVAPHLLPQVSGAEPLGLYKGKIPVYPAIGDNQTSFLGATGGERDAMVVNVGTGSQFSVYTPVPLTCPGLELRPFGNGFLLVGASLCGGRAYALLEQLFRQTVLEMTGTAPDSCYEAMERLLSQGRPGEVPVLVPLFQGTRQNPLLRGRIGDLSTENFTPRHLVWAMLEGMTEELYGMYRQYLDGGGMAGKLVGSGNGIRKNPYLQQCMETRFGQPMHLSQCAEEAATGAALYAAMQTVCLP